jgi:GAF domain-containing protein
MSERQTPLSHSFCKHVVTDNQPLIVDDAREHPILKDNKATAYLGVVGYLGMPLTTADGHPIGSFCVIDDQPREWTDEEIDIIRELAMSVMTEIDLRAQIAAREIAEAELQKRNNQYKRVYHFTNTTLNHMKDMIEIGAEAEEIGVYIADMERELARL